LEAEAGGSQVPSQPGLYNEILLQKQTKIKQNTKTITKNITNKTNQTKIPPPSGQNLILTFFFWVSMGFELRASHLARQASTT
jgi:hypothetical protein